MGVKWRNKIGKGIIDIILIALLLGSMIATFTKDSIMACFAKVRFFISYHFCLHTSQATTYPTHIHNSFHKVSQAASNVAGAQLTYPTQKTTA